MVIVICYTRGVIWTCIKKNYATAKISSINISKRYSELNKIKDKSIHGGISVII
jgi:hypothetical protein